MPAHRDHVKSKLALRQWPDISGLHGGLCSEAVILIEQR